MLFITRQYKPAENQNIKMTIKPQPNLPDNDLLCDPSLTGGSGHDRETRRHGLHTSRLAVRHGGRALAPGQRGALPLPPSSRESSKAPLADERSVSATAVEMQTPRNLLHSMVICSVTEPLSSSLTLTALLQLRHTHQIPLAGVELSTLCLLG